MLSPAVLWLRSRRSIRRHWFLSSFVLAVILVIIIILCLLLAVLLAGRGENIFLNAGSNTPTLVHLGHIYQINLDDFSIQISWLITGCGKNFSMNHAPLFPGSECGILSKTIDLYIDGSTQINASYDPSLHSRNPMDNNTIYIQARNEFQTTHLLDINGAKGDKDRTFTFPFDFYRMTTVIVAVDHGTNETLDIERLGLVDFSNNFSPSFEDSAVQTPFNGTFVPSRQINLILQRALLAKAFALIIFIVNWGLTAIAVYLSLAGLRKGSDLSEGALFFPATVILTIPSLRALMVGNPPFGILLDAIGLFLQMIIVALCSIVLLVIIGLKAVEKPDTNVVSADKSPEIQYRALHQA